MALTSLITSIIILFIIIYIIMRTIRTFKPRRFRVPKMPKSKPVKFSSPKVSFGKSTFLKVFLGIIILFLLFLLFTIVPAGHAGVKDTLGVVADEEFVPGFHIKNPLTRVVMMSVKTQELEEKSAIPSKEGLTVTLDVSILYKVNPTDANEIYKKIGTNYKDIVIVPQLRSRIRDVTAEYEAKALYTTGREVIADHIYDGLAPELAKRGIILERVLLRDVKLPLTVTTAIEAKLKAEQEIEQKRFEVAREEQEADRKRAEARGIRDAQTIIAESLTSPYLTWYWIQSLKEHESVIYVPIGDDGLPLFRPVGTIAGNGSS